MRIFFLLVVPYFSLFLFLLGIIFRIVLWAKSPTPFRITLVSGQQESLPWIKRDRLESPPSNGWAILRIITEAFFFRSLLRGETFSLKNGKLIFRDRRYLWFFSLVFHLCLLLVILRHLRFFFEPSLSFVLFLSKIDGILEISRPTLFLSSFGLLFALFYLLLRRILDERVRYISLPSDYFFLILLLSIGGTGVLLRHFFRVDLLEVKKIVLGLVSFKPYLPSELNFLFILHLFLVCSLFAILPFSKIVHMVGLFFSPTRNLPNTSRKERHINPWDYPVKTRSYKEYEEEFREAMKNAHIPCEVEDG